MKTIFKQIIYITLLSIILALINNYFILENSIDLIKNKKAANAMSEGSFVIPDFMTEPQIVNTEFTKHYFEDDNAVIIDARDVEQYNELHIDGSINIPYNYYEEYDILYDLKVDDIYIVYCNGGECSLSLDLAYVMYDEFDFETVFVYEDGLPEWKNHGYPIANNIDNIIENLDDTIASPNLDMLKFFSMFLLCFIYFFFMLQTFKDESKTKGEALKTVLVVSFRLILGYVFIYASIQKIINPLEFSNQIDLYDATPVFFNNIIGLIIPWIELLIGLALIFNRSIKGSILLSIFLFAVFIILLSQAYFRGISLDCGCFGSEAGRTAAELSADMLKRIREDIIFLCMSLYLYFIYLFDRKEHAN